MADITLANISEALKTFYLPGVRNQINEEADPLWAELQKTSEHVYGDKIRMFLRYGRSGGIAALGEMDDLPEPNPRKGKQVEFSPKNLFARLRISVKAIEATKDNRGAFVNALEKAMEDLVADAKDYVQWQVYGDGSGKIATVSAVSGTGPWTLTVDTVVGLAEGMLIDIYDSTGTTKRNDGILEVTGVNDETNTITVQAVTGTLTNPAADDVIYRRNSKDQEMTGLAAIMTPNNTIYGLDRSQNPWFNPTRVAVNGEIDEVTIQRGLDRAWTRTGVKVDFLVGSFGVRRAWQNLLTAYRQLVNTVELRGGFRAPVYDNNGQVVPFLAAKYARPGKLWGIPRERFVVAWMGDWNWMDQDGAILSRVPNKAAYEATLYMFAELACDTPAGCVEWYGITEH